MKKIRALALAALLLLGLFFPAEAASQPVTDISSPEELMKLRENPSGVYRLTRDLDMTGIDWIPFPFSGVLEGAGHALLNLTIRQTGLGTATTYDGNMKTYDTSFAGLFTTLQGGQVRGLSLLGLDVLVTSDEPCFIGGIAGFMENGSITGCTVAGTLELRAHDRMFGVGGIVGFGYGSIDDSQADVVLICTDTDAATKDEQFLGGAYAAGYVDLDGCTISIDGYISDHGYVHSGGAVGMYALYPKGTTYSGHINRSTVKGKITFFEDNADRRAYCKDFVGEVLNWTYEFVGNRAEFLRDERFDYSAELRPEMCEKPILTQTTHAPTCEEFGYTVYSCTVCGSTHTGSYTLRQHTVKQWILTKAPTEEAAGESQGICTQCGATAYKEEPRLTPQPTETPTEPTAPPPTEPGSAERAPRRLNPLLLVLLVLLVAALGVCLAMYRREQQRRRRRKRRRPPTQ